MNKKLRYCQKRTQIQAAAVAFFFALVLVQGIGAALAANLPNSIDAGRIQTKNYAPSVVPPSQKDVPLSQDRPSFLVPPVGANKTMLFLRDLKVDGATVYTKSQLQSLYQKDLGQKIPLSRLWEIANAITQKYREDGYFLSRAYIPQQEIVDAPRIAIVEGYISEVELDSKWKKVSIVQKVVADIQLQKPVRLSQLEESMLRLNKLPGTHFSSVLGLSKVQPLGEGGVKLAIKDEQESSQFTASISNFGSKYLGPTVANLNWHGVVVPLQETQASVSFSSDRTEVKAISASHKIPVSIQDSFIIVLDHSKSVPGDTLQVQDIQSTSTSASLSWLHNWVNTRKLDVTTSVGLGARHSIGHILGTLLSRDDIRTMSLGLTASGAYFLGGYSANIGAVKGLPSLGGSDKNDINLSRPRAGNDFQKVTADLQTSIPLLSNWQGLIRAQGQFASRSLPSSEEFGFGGPIMGRGYDDSELTGDNGIASTLELSYMGQMKTSSLVPFRPYVFYDVGKVWNINAGQATNVSASSAGLGVSAYLNGSGAASGWQTNAFIAKPLTKTIDNPQQGGPDSLQLRFQLSRQF